MITSFLSSVSVWGSRRLRRACGDSEQDARSRAGCDHRCLVAGQRGKPFAHAVVQLFEIHVKARRVLHRGDHFWRHHAAAQLRQCGVGVDHRPNAQVVIDAHGAAGPFGRVQRTDVKETISPRRLHVHHDAVRIAVCQTS